MYYRKLRARRWELCKSCADLRATRVSLRRESHPSLSTTDSVGTMSAVLAVLCPPPTRFHRQPPTPTRTCPQAETDSPQTLPNILQGTKPWAENSWGQNSLSPLTHPHPLRLSPSGASGWELIRPECVWVQHIPTLSASVLQAPWAENSLGHNTSESLGHNTSKSVNTSPPSLPLSFRRLAPLATRSVNGSQHACHLRAIWCQGPTTDSDLTGQESGPAHRLLVKLLGV